MESIVIGFVLWIITTACLAGFDIIMKIHRDFIKEEFAELVGTFKVIMYVLISILIINPTVGITFEHIVIGAFTTFILEQILVGAIERCLYTYVIKPKDSELLEKSDIND